MMVYLAGPVDDVDVLEADGWREQVAELLTERNLVAFFPNRASISRRSRANSSGNSQPCSGAAWSKALVFCSSSAR